jgi:hypothetical protein
MQILTRTEADVVDAIASVFFPPGGAIEADSHDTHIVAYVDRFVSQLPRPEQVKIRALLQLVERGYAAKALNPMARFSQATESQQADFLRELESAGSAARRGVFQALRSLMTIAYMEHPSVREQMGAPGPEYRGMITPEAAAARPIELDRFTHSDVVDVHPDVVAGAAVATSAPSVVATA